MPHLAEQDDRRALAAPAQRARLLPAPIAPPPARVLVITGPSGVGKGTVIRALRERTGGLEVAVSATTRAPRPGEENGRDYHFLSSDEFERRLAAGQFLEHATYAGNRYGTLRSELERPALILVLEIEIQGARQVREVLPEAMRVFVAPPSIDALRERLAGRGSDSPGQVESRLAAAADEIRAQSEFEHVVVNDRLEPAVDELEGLVATMRDTES